MARGVDPRARPLPRVRRRRALTGGIVEHDTATALWLPYVAVASVPEATACARDMGGSVLAEPRLNARGIRSVVADSANAPIALWQPR